MQACRKDTIEHDEQGVPVLVRAAADGRRAACLKGNSKGNLLTRLLKEDPHIGPFLEIPGKDNGFDIEGLAVDGNRLLLGTCAARCCAAGRSCLKSRSRSVTASLQLAPLDDEGTLLRKHFRPA